MRHMYSIADQSFNFSYCEERGKEPEWWLSPGTKVEARVEEAKYAPTSRGPEQMELNAVVRVTDCRWAIHVDGFGRMSLYMTSNVWSDPLLVLLARWFFSGAPQTKNALKYGLKKQAELEAAKWTFQDEGTRIARVTSPEGRDALITLGVAGDSAAKFQFADEREVKVLYNVSSHREALVAVLTPQIDAYPHDGRAPVSPRQIQLAVYEAEERQGVRLPCNGWKWESSARFENWRTPSKKPVDKAAIAHALVEMSKSMSASEIKDTCENLFGLRPEETKSGTIEINGVAVARRNNEREWRQTSGHVMALALLNPPAVPKGGVTSSHKWVEGVVYWLISGWSIPAPMIYITYSGSVYLAVGEKVACRISNHSPERMLNGIADIRVNDTDDQYEVREKMCADENLAARLSEIS